MDIQPSEDGAEMLSPLSSYEWSHAGREAASCLLIHGLGDSLQIWNQIGPALANLLRTVAVDLRGHGNSAWNPSGSYDIAGHVDDVSRLPDRCTGPRLLVGHSLGGEIALRLAGQRPEAILGVILVDYNPCPDPAVVERLLQGLRADLSMRFATDHAYLQHLRRTRPLASHSVLAELARSALRRCEDAGGLMLKCDPRLASFDIVDEIANCRGLWQLLTELPVPMLIARGSGSALLPRAVCERMAAAARRGRMTTISRSGHAVMCDNPDELAAKISVFARELLTVGGSD
jgi:pimeloyl-ACP methyl ester carboxylesterase